MRWSAREGQVGEGVGCDDLGLKRALVLQGHPDRAARPSGRRDAISGQDVACSVKDDARASAAPMTARHGDGHHAGRYGVGDRRAGSGPVVLHYRRSRGGSACPDVRGTGGGGVTSRHGIPPGAGDELEQPGGFRRLSELCTGLRHRTLHQVPGRVEQGHCPLKPTSIRNG